MSDEDEVEVKERDDTDTPLKSYTVHLRTGGSSEVLDEREPIEIALELRNNRASKSAWIDFGTGSFAVSEIVGFALTLDAGDDDEDDEEEGEAEPDPADQIALNLGQ